MPNLFWDSCILYAYLDRKTTHDTSGIEQYLQEAKDGKHRIFASSLILAEIVPSAITKPDVGTLQEFIEELQSAITIISPSPDVMLRAALLKDLPYRKLGGTKTRRLGTADAIILATCIEVIEVWDVTIDAFHTFDDGKTRGPEGRMVPLLSYHEWQDEFSEDQNMIADAVVQLNRCKPIHPEPFLLPIGTVDN